MKLHVDEDELWSDLLAFYKCVTSPGKKRLKIRMDSSRAIDTGGVRRHVYTMAYSDLIHNKHIKLFDGPANHARPYSCAETRGSGIFKALGMMVGHSISYARWSWFSLFFSVMLLVYGRGGGEGIRFSISKVCGGS